MKKINIALFAGGNSSEREVSLGSAAQVGASLDRSKYNVYTVDLSGTSWAYSSEEGIVTQVDKNDFSLPLPTGKITLDYALIMIHGTPGEDGKLQGYLEMMGIPFSSCDLVSTVMTFDKQACKRAVGQAGLNLADEIIVRKGEAVNPDSIISRVGLPLFVKPNASGSSCGVTKVSAPEQIVPAIENAAKESTTVMIERYIEGHEFSCGILATKEKVYILPVTEIISKNDFFDYEAKYTPGRSDEITPAEVTPDILAKLNNMTVAAYRACGCRGVVRIDFIVTDDGKPYFIEINSVPGMSAGSIVPQQVAHAGMSLGQLFDIVIEDTFFMRK